jgi:hypothetical protein
MFLGLVCEYVENHREFPDGPREVFEAHVELALGEIDGEARFHLSSDLIRDIAQEIAFCMAATPRLGLSATVDDILEAMSSHRIDRPSESVAGAIRALNYVRLTRADREAAVGDRAPISFSHRRFQEYFATGFVLANPSRISALNLLTEGQWRETAVTILQTRSPQQADALLADIDDLLQVALEEIERLLPLPKDDRTGKDPAADGNAGARFVWPSRALHLLGILDAGLRAELGGAVIDSIRRSCDRLVTLATEYGIVVDQKWALEVAGPVTEPVLLKLLKEAFSSGVAWVQDVAFRQVSRLIPLPDDFARQVCYGLVTYSVGGRLRRDSLSVGALLKGLGDGRRFSQAARYVVAAPFVDLAVHALLGVYALSQGPLQAAWSVLLALAASHLTFFLFRSSTIMAWTVERSPLRSVLEAFRSSRNVGIDTAIVGYVLILMRWILSQSAAGDSPLTGALLIAALSWAPCLLLCVRFNLLDHMNLMVLVPQVFLTVATVRRAIREVKSRGLVRVILTLAMAFLAAALVVACLVGAGYAVNNSTAAQFGMLVLFLGLFVASAVLMLIYCVRFLWNYRGLRRLRANPPRVLSSDDVLHVLLEFRGKWAVRSFRSLREARTFRRSPQVVEVLRDLSWCIEHRYFEKRGGSMPNASELPPSLKDWLSEDAGRLKATATLGAAFLDELGPAIEDASLARSEEEIVGQSV